MSDWQPIKTAPKDGTRVLLVWEYGLVLAHWTDDAAFKQCAFGPGWEVDRSEGDCWYAFSLRPDQPTHWMPLPEPPK
jgi:hypothetical protein